MSSFSKKIAALQIVLTVAAVAGIALGAEVSWQIGLVVSVALAVAGATLSALMMTSVLAKGGKKTAGSDALGSSQFPQR